MSLQTRLPTIEQLPYCAKIQTTSIPFLYRFCYIIVTIIQNINIIFSVYVFGQMQQCTIETKIHDLHARYVLFAILLLCAQGWEDVCGVCMHDYVRNIIPAAEHLDLPTLAEWPNKTNNERNKYWRPHLSWNYLDCCFFVRCWVFLLSSRQKYRAWLLYGERWYCTYHVGYACNFRSATVEKPNFRKPIGFCCGKYFFSGLF